MPAQLIFWGGSGVVDLGFIAPQLILPPSFAVAGCAARGAGTPAGSSLGAPGTSGRGVAAEQPATRPVTAAANQADEFFTMP